MSKARLFLIPLLLLTLGAHSAPLKSEKHLEIKTYPQEMRKAFTTADGLPSDDVRAIALVGGDVYAGTAEGLARWDGKEWKRVADAPGNIRVLLGVGSSLYIAAENRVHQLVDGKLSMLASEIPAPANALFLDTVNPPHQPTEALLVATDAGLYAIQAGVTSPINVLDDSMEPITEIRDVAVNAEGATLVTTPVGAFRLLKRGGGFHSGAETMTKAMRAFQWQRVLPKQGERGWNMVNARRLMVTEDDRLLVAAPQGVAQQTSGDYWQLSSGIDGLPFNEFTCIDHADRLWLGTKNGVIHYDGIHWAYRAGKRWLPDNDVRDIVATEGGAWIATAGGVSHLYFQPMSFAEKAAFYEAEIDKYHRRTPFGYVAGVRLKNPGDKSEWTQYDTDNDGQYTGLYGAAECLAYGATADPKAKERASKAFEALAFLSEVTQSGSNPAPRGFIARTIRSTDDPDPNEHDSVEHDRKKREGDALWKVLEPRWPTSGDGNWYWKTDASSDELDGHFLLYALYYDHVATSDSEKARVREVCTRVMDHLIEHDFRLVDHDGQPTRWGNFNPESLNNDPDWWTERGLNSLSLLTYLSVTHHITGEQKYRDVFMELVEKHHYALNGMVMPKLQAGPGSHVQFDDKMAFMNYYNLIRYEEDPKIRRMFQNSIFYYWQIIKQERNPFFNFVYAALCEGQGMETQWGVTDLSPTGRWLEDSVDTLKRFPMDLVMWPVTNSHRSDLIPLADYTREPGKAEGHGYRVDGYVIPIDERNALSFSEDTWRYDDAGGQGKTLDEGSPFLLGYYLGLYHGFITD